MKECKKDDIVFIEDSDIVNLLDFGYEHLDCAVIFFDYNKETYEARIFAYVDDPKYNDILRVLFISTLRERGYKYFDGFSSSMVNGIDNN